MPRCPRVGQTTVTSWSWQSCGQAAPRRAVRRHWRARGYEHDARCGLIERGATAGEHVVRCPSRFHTQVFAPVGGHLGTRQLRARRADGLCGASYAFGRTCKTSATGLRSSPAQSRGRQLGQPAVALRSSGSQHEQEVCAAGTLRLERPVHRSGCRRAAAARRTPQARTLHGAGQAKRQHPRASVGWSVDTMGRPIAMAPSITLESLEQRGRHEQVALRQIRGHMAREAGEQHVLESPFASTSCAYFHSTPAPRSRPTFIWLFTCGRRG